MCAWLQKQMIDLLVKGFPYTLQNPCNLQSGRKIFHWDNSSLSTNRIEKLDLSHRTACGIFSLIKHEMMTGAG